MKIDISDTSKEKTVESSYVDPVTFEPKVGLWYSTKKAFKISFGELS